MRLVVLVCSMLVACSPSTDDPAVEREPAAADTDGGDTDEDGDEDGGDDDGGDQDVPVVRAPPVNCAELNAKGLECGIGEVITESNCDEPTSLLPACQYGCFVLAEFSDLFGLMCGTDFAAEL